LVSELNAALIADGPCPDPHPESTHSVRRPPKSDGQKTLEARRYAVAAASLRTVMETITRETPLMIMLTPTIVPRAHAELAGH